MLPYHFFLTIDLGTDAASNMKAIGDLVSHLNAVKLKEEEVVEAIRAAIEAYDSGESYLTASVTTTMQLFVTAPHKAKAIICRLQALVVMMENNELKNWTQADGFKIIPAAQRALIAAVADHPLALIDGDISFEKESFLQRVLEFAEPQGNQTI
jgi:hypothetical protein